MNSVKYFSCQKILTENLRKKVAKENRLIKSIVKTLIEYLSKNKTVKKQNIN